MTDLIALQPITADTSEDQVQRLTDYIDDTGLKPLPLPEEFFYASLPLCVIDAVFSIGVTYTSTRNTVIRFCEIQKWEMSLEPDVPRENGEHKIVEFLNLSKDLTPDQMADSLFGNRQRTSTQSGILKAEAVQRFAEVLKEAGIEDFGDLTDERLTEAEIQVCRIPGQKSGISFDYFRMLAGDDSRIKPDRMVQRYIAKAIGREPQQVGPDMARDLMQATTSKLVLRQRDWSPRRLDYAIWKTESGNA